jgi:hypothetical protein
VEKSVGKAWTPTICRELIMQIALLLLPFPSSVLSVINSHRGTGETWKPGHPPFVPPFVSNFCREQIKKVTTHIIIFWFNLLSIVTGGYSKSMRESMKAGWQWPAS